MSDEVNCFRKQLRKLQQLQTDQAEIYKLRDEMNAKTVGISAEIAEWKETQVAKLQSKLKKLTNKSVSQLQDVQEELKRKNEECNELQLKLAAQFNEKSDTQEELRALQLKSDAQLKDAQLKDAQLKDAQEELREFQLKSDAQLKDVQLKDAQLKDAQEDLRELQLKSDAQLKDSQLQLKSDSQLKDARLKDAQEELRKLQLKSDSQLKDVQLKDAQEELRELQLKSDSQLKDAHAQLKDAQEELREFQLKADDESTHKMEECDELQSKLDKLESELTDQNEIFDENESSKDLVLETDSFEQLENAINDCVQLRLALKEKYFKMQDKLYPSVEKSVIDLTEVEKEPENQAEDLKESQIALEIHFEEVLELLMSKKAKFKQDLVTHGARAAEIQMKFDIYEEKLKHENERHLSFMSASKEKISNQFQKGFEEMKRVKAMNDLELQVTQLNLKLEKVKQEHVDPIEIDLEPSDDESQIQNVGQTRPKRAASIKPTRLDSISFTVNNETLNYKSCKLCFAIVSHGAVTKRHLQFQNNAECCPKTVKIPKRLALAFPNEYKEYLKLTRGESPAYKRQIWRGLIIKYEN